MQKTFWLNVSLASYLLNQKSQVVRSLMYMAGDIITKIPSNNEVRYEGS